MYIVRCNDGSLYTGYAIDIQKRIKEHNGVGRTKTELNAGSKYTRARRPVSLVYSESFLNRSEAMKRESTIKKMTRLGKEKLINIDF